MHSETVEKFASPRRRILSRAMSEEESLRHIIEAEESPKRLTRRDSRYGSLRRGDTRGSQSEDEPADNTSMIELRQDYEMCVAELQSVELRQEVLLFQIDCLQDALEGAEETLTETKREAQQFSLELEREREQRRKLEDTVALLMQELEQLNTEKISVSTESELQEQKHAVGVTDNPAVEVDGYESKETLVQSANTVSQPTTPTNTFANLAATALLLFKNRRFLPLKQDDLDGTSVDQEVKEAEVVGSEQAAPEESSHKAPDAEDHDESSGYEDAPSDFSPGCSTPDTGPPDAVLPEDRENELKSGNEARNVNNPDACLLS